MKRCLWLCVVFLLAGHIPVVSADAACEGRFVNPITDICWTCIFPLSLGSTKVSQGKVPDTANPSMPIQFCPAPPPIFKRIGLAIGYWEPMALTDVTRSPGCMVNLGMTIPALGKTGQGSHSSRGWVSTITVWAWVVPLKRLSLAWRWDSSDKNNGVSA